jgi:hypothetical protein
MSRDKPKDTKEWTVQLLLHIGQPGMAKEIEEWDVPRFPVNGHMIKEHAKDISALKIQYYALVPQFDFSSDGRQLGMLGQELRVLWVESDFKANAEELLKNIPELVEKIKENAPGKKSK